MQHSWIYLQKIVLQFSKCYPTIHFLWRFIVNEKRLWFAEKLGLMLGNLLRE